MEIASFKDENAPIIKTKNEHQEKNNRKRLSPEKQSISLKNLESHCSLNKL